MTRAGRHLLPIVGILLIVSAAAAVDIGKGVRFGTQGANSTIDTGKQYSFDTVTVYDDAVRFEGNNVSVTHNATRLINATLWNYTVAEIVGTPSIKIGTNTSDGKIVTFNFTGVVEERTYTVEKEGNRLVNVETGTDAVLTWNESTWDGPANFTATLLEALQNATVIFKGSFGHPDDTVTIDGDSGASEGTFTDVDFGYAAFELGGEVAGIVPGGTFLELVYRDTGSAYRFEQTQSIEDNVFLLPLTEGGSGVIEDRQGAIQGTLFGGGNFLGFPSPTFAYDIDEQKTVRVSLSYDAFAIDGFEGTISPGTYTLTITNEGVEDGTTQINVSVQ